MSALSEKDDAMQCDTVIEAERYDTLRRATVLESFLAANDAQLEAAHCAIEAFWADYDVVLRQMGNSTRKVSHRDFAFSRFMKCW